MLGYVQGILIVTLEMLCCRIFFETFGVKRDENNRWKGNAIMAALVIGVFVSAALLYNFFFLKQILVIAIIAILMKIYIRISISKSFILSALFQGLLIIVDYFAWLINTSFFHSMDGMDERYVVQSTLVIVFGKVLLFFIVLLIRKYMGKDILVKLIDTEWIKFIAFPAFTICVISAMIKSANGMESRIQGDVFLAIAFGLAGINIAVFYLIYDVIKRESEIYEAQIYRLKAKSQISMYRSISENFEKQKKKTHEYKNQIMCINSLLKKKNYDALERFMDKIDTQIKKELDCICTNHVIVDAVLNTKYQEAREKGIVLVLKVNDLSRLSISDEDTVVILSNLLNNAIEACDKCNGNRIIKLKFVIEEDEIILSVKNTYESAVIYENGQIKTTKDDSDVHGIGIKNIIETIEKYKGRYAIQNDEHEFYFSTMIPLTEK